MKKLTTEASKLLQYIYEHKDSACSDLFSTSLLSARHILGQKTVGELTPIVNELVQAKVLKEVRKGIFKVPRFKIIEKNLEKYIQDAEEEKFVQEYRESLKEDIKNHNRFVITTGVMGKDVNKPFLEAIKNYCVRKKAMPVVLPCEDVASRGKKESSIELSPELKDFKVIFKDTYLNKNLCLHAIKMSAKQRYPLGGLDEVATLKQASIIAASPKVFLKYIPNMHYDVPPALMTTGAITVNNYDTDRYMSQRTSTLAEVDHIYGAIIVEIENEHIFHFRHIQASETGSFVDLGVEYLPDGTTREVTNTVLVMGDSHVGYHDLELHERVMELAENIGVSKVVLHDIFHGTSISHHEWDKSITRAQRAIGDQLDLEVECKAIKNYLEDIESRGIGIIIPQANHHGHLMKYLQKGKYVDDAGNLDFASKLVSPAVHGRNPLQYAVEDLLGFKKSDIEWLQKDQSYRVHGVECAVHGDKGANGAKGSLATFEKALGNCVVAHSHTAAIRRRVFCVGTVGKMDMGYNEGLSSWTRTCCLIYSNGTKQLINFIENKFGEYSYTI